METETEKGLLFRAVLNAMNGFPEKQLVVKLHPIDDGKIYWDIAKETRQPVVITKNVDIYKLLSACDLLMVVNSSVVLEAIILDKPVVLINLTNRPNLYTQYEATVGVYAADSIAPTIKKMLSGEMGETLEDARKKFVYNYAYIQDGQTSKRVVALIEQMINYSKTSLSN